MNDQLFSPIEVLLFAFFSSVLTLTAFFWLNYSSFSPLPNSLPSAIINEQIRF